MAISDSPGIGFLRGGDQEGFYHQILSFHLGWDGNSIFHSQTSSSSFLFLLPYVVYSGTLWPVSPRAICLSGIRNIYVLLRKHVFIILWLTFCFIFQLK